jgi:restriction endonuclease S subunit
VTEDINNNVIETSRLHYISEEVHLLLHKSHCFKRQVLLTMAGAYLGQAAVFNENFECSSNQAIAKITLKPNSINPYYLSTFLNCRYGQSQIERFRTGTGQPNLNLGLIKTIKVVKASNHFQGAIDKGVNTALDLRREGINIYEEAQTLLLSELGFTDWQPKHQLTFVKNYSDTEQAERIDADYFQPKYEEIVHVIKSHSDGWDTLGNLVQLKDENFRPADKTEYKYIELANIAGNGEITGCMIEQGQDLPSRARRKVTMGDVIVSSVEGSLDSIALIDEEYDQALCSTGFHVVNSQAFNSETLLVLLKSIVGQLQLKKGCSGTILTAINKDEFGRVILPIIAEEKQKQIQQKVVESFNLRKQSKHLLECAKRAVEIAIEEDEQTAIDWLETEIQEVTG